MSIYTKFVQILSLSFLFMLFSRIVYAQTDPLPVSNDKALLINSKMLNEERSIWIHLPSDYNSSDQTYPVLYLLDGDGHFGYASAMVDYLSDYDRNRIPKMIVVAIPNVDRGRDFRPLSTGGGAKFLQFIKDELVPEIEANYRTQPYRILAAHSLGGLFALYAKESAPELFRSTILMSPALDGENKKIQNDFGPFLKSHQNLRDKYFISIGNEKKGTVDSLVVHLKANSSTSVTWKFNSYPDENHFSVTYKSMFDGLKFIYASWFSDNYDAITLSLSDVKKRFERLSAEFGYTIRPTEEFLNSAGYKQLRSGNIDAAIELFKQNTLNFPDSYNGYDSLGEAYMKKGMKDLAIKNYEKSISINPNNEDGKEMLEKLKGTK